MKFGDLNLLEPSGALQDCNGIALLSLCSDTSQGRLFLIVETYQSNNLVYII